jgi:hypothetical protein
MESTAVEWGVPASEFWSMTYEEIAVQVEANRKRYELEMRNRSMFDYNAAQLNAFAFNDPNKMPKAEKMYPFLLTEEERERQKPLYLQEYDEDEDFEILMRNVRSVNKVLGKESEADGT